MCIIAMSIIYLFIITGSKILELQDQVFQFRILSFIFWYLQLNVLNNPSIFQGNQKISETVIET